MWYSPPTLRKNPMDGQGNVPNRKLCRDPGSNRGPSDLRSDALPTELSRLHANCVALCIATICRYASVAWSDAGPQRRAVSEESPRKEYQRRSTSRVRELKSAFSLGGGCAGSDGTRVCHSRSQAWAACMMPLEYMYPSGNEPTRKASII